MTKFRAKLFLSAVCVLALFCHSYAQDPAKVDRLKQQILQAGSREDLYAAFEETADLYFNADRYDEFVNFLSSLAKEKKELEPLADYFTALCRYYQLKYLEEAQNWDEYFAQGNAYRDQIVASAQKVLDATASGDAPHLYARLILWKFHKDQQDAFSDEAMENLMRAAAEYAQGSADIMPVKAVADELSAYAEKGKSRELYKIYVNRILSSDIRIEDLKNTAADFYEQGNSELAQFLYDAYLERISKDYPKERLIPVLTDIARKFSSPEAKAGDPLYAEKIFQRIEETGGKETFEQELIYLRAKTLEKAKLYAQAKDAYIDLVGRFTDSPHADEANFKTGIIYTYILRDAKSGKDYFEKLARQEAVTPQVISSLYQLGLLKQWEADNSGAGDYYQRLIDKAKGGYAQTAALAQERLKEINAAKPLDYNLQSLLDACLKEENAGLDMTKLDLKSSPPVPKKNKEVEITSVAYTAESGCTQVQIQYLWSGDLGAAQPASTQPSFSTRYDEPGTYIVGLIAVSPSGIIDRGLAIIDVQ